MPKRKVEKRLSFEQAIVGTSLENCLQENLEALGKGNSQKVQVADPNAVKISVDIDTCLKNEYPNANRWDYAIVYRPKRMEETYYVEIHPATPKEVEKVVKKKEWLENFLSQEVPKLTYFLPDSQFYWIASGKMAILPNSKEFKELATKGIKLTGLLKIS